MPLAFRSENFGEIAFGFFNIETDMLLLEHYFFFADEFCNCIIQFAKSENPENFQYQIDGYKILDINKIGDLLGAIHGIRFTGFIGEVYRVFPFPKLPENFKQSPEGYKNQGLIKEIIKKYGEETKIQFEINNSNGNIQIEEYEFSKDVFMQLINYVYAGGYPRWKDEVRPAYVIKMINAIKNSRNYFFL